MQGRDEEGPDRAEEQDPLRELALASALPPDAQRMGLDRNTEEGALVAMAASLDRSRPAHRVVAWLLLLALVGPLLLGVLGQIL